MKKKFTKFDFSIIFLEIIGCIFLEIIGIKEKDFDYIIMFSFLSIILSFILLDMLNRNKNKKLKQLPKINY